MRSGFGCLAIIMVACGVACGGGSSGSPDAPPGDAGAPAFDVDGAAHSGTRLKLQWYEFDGGRALATMFDATRAERCAPRGFDGDGDNLRCRPAASGSGIVFGDPGCTQQLGFNAQPACRPADYFQITSDDPSSPAPTKLHARSTAPAPPAYYSGGPGACGGPHDAEGPYQLSLLGPEVALGEFAQVTLGDYRNDGPLRARYYESQDGARWPHPAMFDADLDDECFAIASLDGKTASCPPVHALTSIEEYTDPGCTVRGAQGSATSRPKYMRVLDGSCPVGFLGTFLVASAAPTQTLYSNHRGCEPETLDPGTAAYAIGAPAQLKSLPRAPRASGGGRLEPLRYSDGRVVISAVGFYDSQLATICYPTELADGTTRCVPPSGLTSSAMFSDAQCEDPIHVANVQAGLCGDAEIPKFAVDESPGCLNSRANKVIHEVRRVVGSYPGPVYYNANPGCAQLTGFTSYQLSDPIPLDQLAAATLTTDP